MSWLRRLLLRLERSVSPRTRAFLLGMARADDSDRLLETPSLPPGVRRARRNVEELRRRWRRVPTE